MPIHSLAALASAPKSASFRLAAILEWARTSIDSEMDKAGIENIILRSQKAYDDYVKPIDIPWMDESMESTFIDEPMKKILAEAIHGFHQIVHRKGA